MWLWKKKWEFQQWKEVEIGLERIFPSDSNPSKEVKNEEYLTAKKTTTQDKSI